LKDKYQHHYQANEFCAQHFISLRTMEKFEITGWILNIVACNNDQISNIQ